MPPRVNIRRNRVGTGGIARAGTAVTQDSRTILDVDAAQQRVGETLVNAGSQVGSTVMQFGVEIAREENRLKHKTSLNGYQTEANEYLTSPDYRDENGNRAIFLREGANTEGMTEEASAKLLEIAEKHQEGMSEAQRLAFMQTVLPEYQGLIRKIGQTEGTQLKVASNQEDQAILQSSRNSALLNYDDPELRNVYTSRMEASIRSTAETNGFSDAQANELVRNEQARLNAQITERYLDNNRPNEARGYLEANKDTMNAQDVDKLENAIDSASNLDLAQKYTASLMAEFQPGVLQEDGRTSDQHAVEAIKADKGLTAEERQFVLNYYRDESIRLRQERLQRKILQSTENNNAIMNASSRAEADQIVASIKDAKQRSEAVKVRETYHPVRQAPNLATPEELRAKDAIEEAIDLKIGIPVKIQDDNGKTYNVNLIPNSAGNVMQVATSLGLTNKDVITELVQYVQDGGVYGKVKWSQIQNATKAVTEGQTIEDQGPGYVDAIYARLPAGEDTITPDILRAIATEVLQEGTAVGSGTFFDSTVARFEVQEDEFFVPDFTEQRIEELKQIINTQGITFANGKHFQGPTAFDDAARLNDITLQRGDRKITVPAQQFLLVEADRQYRFPTQAQQRAAAINLRNKASRARILEKQGEAAQRQEQINREQFLGELSNITGQVQDQVDLSESQIKSIRKTLDSSAPPEQRRVFTTAIREARTPKVIDEVRETEITSAVDLLSNIVSSVSQQAPDQEQQEEEP